MKDNYGFNAFHSLCISNRSNISGKMIIDLINKGIDITDKNNDGMNPQDLLREFYNGDNLNDLIIYLSTK